MSIWHYRVLLYAPDQVYTNSCTGKKWQDRQYTYQHNTEACSHNCCPGKAVSITYSGWSQCLHGLRHRSVVARMLRLWVRIPPGAWMTVCCECCVLLDRGLCDELITHPEESLRMWCVVCDLETSWMRRAWPTGGCYAKKKKKYIFWMCDCNLSYPECNVMHHIITSSVACLAVPHFSTFSHQLHDFWKKGIMNIKCVLIFPTTSVWNTAHSK